MVLVLSSLRESAEIRTSLSTISALRLLDLPDLDIIQASHVVKE